MVKVATYHRRKTDPEDYTVEHVRSNILGGDGNGNGNGATRRLVWAGLFGLIGVLITVVGFMLVAEHTRISTDASEGRAQALAAQLRLNLVEADIRDIKADQKEILKRLPPAR